MTHKQGNTQTLVERLRKAHPMSSQRMVGSNILAEAADEISTLLYRVSQLEADCRRKDEVLRAAKEWAEQIASDERVEGFVHKADYGLYCLLADCPVDFDAALSPAPQPDAAPAGAAGMREAIAQEIWRAESIRATGRERRVSWEDSGSEEDKDRYRFIADCVLSRLRALPITASPTDAAVKALVLTPGEIQSGYSRQKWAEGLIEQLSKDHEGRNSWLLNYGVGEEAQKLQRKRGLQFDPKYQAVNLAQHGVK